MGNLEDDLDYFIKTYREHLVKFYNENNGNIEATKVYMKSNFYTDDAQIESEIKFLSQIGLIELNGH